MKAPLLPIPFVVLTLAFAGNGPVRAQASPDPKHGEILAAQGNKNGAAPCSQCHGLSGAGNPTGPFPSLAGQSAAYLLKQLHNYADGSRPNNFMTPIAQALSEQDKQDVADYFANLQNRLPKAAQPQPNVEKRGRELALIGVASIGDGSKGVQACANCHGPAGIGEPPLYPSLAGQWSGYASTQLSAFKSGQRHNDISAVMREVAAQLSPDDINAVARYYESLRGQQVRH